jgi:hypothetical protein
MGSDPAPDGNPILVFPASATVPPTAVPAVPATKDFESVSDNVFHVAVSFLTAKGYSMDTALANSADVKGVVISVAVLDPANRKLLSTGQFATLGTALDQGTLNLPADVQGSTSPLSVWQQNFNRPDFANRAGVPSKVAGAVRIYQRIFYVEE